MTERTGKQLIDSIYKNYSKYVLMNRAIPSAIDGLKPVQRKILFKALKESRGKEVKVSDMGGISAYGYHHGEGSAQAACVGMAAPWKNNLPILEAHGNFGSRMIQEAAAPRYIFVSLGKTFDQCFSDIDVAPISDDPDTPEPLHYLPNIPWALINGIEGIAVGFATEILPRSSETVKAACKAYIKNGKTVPLPPSFPEFRGLIEPSKDVPNKWNSFGIVTKEKYNNYLIEELPWGYDREKYYGLLLSMEESGLIDNCEDLCDDSGFRFRVKIGKDKQQKFEQDPLKYLKLVKTHSENITTIGHDGTLKLFETANDLLVYFCDYRLQKVEEQIRYDLEVANKQLLFLEAKEKFIKHISDGDLDPRKYNITEFTQYIQDTYHTDEDDSKKLANIPVSHMNSDSLDNLRKTIEATKTKIQKLESTDAKTIFLERLK